MTVKLVRKVDRHGFESHHKEFFYLDAHPPIPDLIGCGIFVFSLYVMTVNFVYVQIKRLRPRHCETYKKHF